ncbi:uncharacterized protein LOC128984672 [Macrosteles quadrilineatus]|uniref:uncharacterized protein LOC128984672 n=1 Tax=Macrosteles quadrilineatus TaxID=74068 RepID=UPI0023E1C6ED|nr:uncharacterized protein LOC128984672 [Macrosteles quadrilineatus]
MKLERVVAEKSENETKLKTKLIELTNEKETQSHQIQDLEKKLDKREKKFIRDIEGLQEEMMCKIKEDMRRLKISLVDLENKSEALAVLKDKNIILPIAANNQRQGRVVSEEERKQRSERMKKYWTDKKKRKNLKRI